MRGLLIGLGILVGGLALAQNPADNAQRVTVGRDQRVDHPASQAESKYDRAMGTEPTPRVQGSPTCEVAELSLLSQVAVTPSRHGATLRISARDPKQLKTVQNLAQMLDDCIQAAHRSTAPEAPAPSATP